MKTINNIIAEKAAQYVGQKEKPGNSGFEDAVFEKKMKVIGFIKGQAWCSLFTKLVWKEAYEEFHPGSFVALNAFFNPSAVATYNNFKRIKPNYVSIKPVVGSLIAFVKYEDSKPSWKGHIGIVESVSGSHMHTVEGNSNMEGGREGIEVVRHNRKINFGIHREGLVLLGFINPL